MPRAALCGARRPLGLKPTPSAVPTAAKDEKNNNNDEERLGIHDVHSLQCDGYGFGLFTMTTPNRHIIWETPSDKKEVGELRDQPVAGFFCEQPKPSALIACEVFPTTTALETRGNREARARGVQNCADRGRSLRGIFRATAARVVDSSAAPERCSCASPHCERITQAGMIKCIDFASPILGHGTLMPAADRNICAT